MGEQIITRINAQLEKIMAPTQKLPNKFEGGHDVKIELIECASNQPSIVLEDLHLGEVEEVMKIYILVKSKRLKPLSFLWFIRYKMILC